MPDRLDGWLERNRLMHAGPLRYRPTIRLRNVLAALGACTVAAAAHAVGEAVEGPARVLLAAVEFLTLAALASGLARAARDHGRRSWEAGELAFSGTSKAWIAAGAVAVLAVVAPLSLLLD
jgi:hypothetical protein